MPFSLRYAITTSPATLPTTANVGSMIWLLGGLGEGMRWAAWFVTLLTMLAIMDWNSRATLIRQRTRMASTSFIALLTALAFLEPWNRSMLAALCYVVAHIVFSYCYQDTKCQGKAYHAFLLLGIGSFFFRPVLFLLPFFIISLAIQFRALTWRSLAASVLGVLTPYWLVVLWCTATGDWQADLLWRADDITLSWFSWSALDGPRRAALLFTLLYVGIALVDYIRTYYQDKFRTRMFIYTIMLQLVGIGLMLLVLSKDFDSTMRLLCCCAAPLIGHHLSLARGRFVNWYFSATLLLLLFLTIYTRM